MFVIEVKNVLGDTSRHYWMNGSEDDFLRYLPKNFGVAKENLRAWKFSDDDFPLLEGVLKALDGKGVLDLSEDGKIKAGRVVTTEVPATEEGADPTTVEAFELLAEYAGQEVAWPYSSEWTLAKPELGAFLGWKAK